MIIDHQDESDAEALLQVLDEAEQRALFVAAGEDVGGDRYPLSGHHPPPGDHVAHEPPVRRDMAKKGMSHLVSVDVETAQKFIVAA